MMNSMMLAQLMKDLQVRIETCSAMSSFVFAGTRQSVAVEVQCDLHKRCVIIFHATPNKPPT
jgi:predicted branched-subunit amino acid permease